ncbi:MAG TPA: flagellar biosynthetic protein FliR [Balneolaceae bacterium]|nr:flagellar biosynthetic protein FliR [Balneolaceae bacterium]
MSVLSVPFILSAFLIFVRVAALVGTAPYFSSGSFPIRIKLFLALVLTVVLSPAIPAHSVSLAYDTHALQILILIIKEFLVGAAMGLTGQLIFAGIRMGGELMSVNMGLSFASVIDPVTQSRHSVVNQLFGMYAILIFISIGGDRFYIQALSKSFSIVPVGAADMALAGPVFIKVAAYLFVVGVQMAAPFIIVLFLLDLSFAIFARIMPQANIFFIALPLKLGIGIILMLLILPYTPTAFHNFFDQLWYFLDMLLHAVF